MPPQKRVKTESVPPDQIDWEAAVKDGSIYKMTINDLKGILIKPSPLQHLFSISTLPKVS